jgi:PTH1 family peptidyl-tRNA hydrolase
MRGAGRSTPIRLIVGLGNPGPHYESTRHNAGFWLADHLAKDLHVSFALEKSFCGLLAKARLDGEQALLLKPHTYMNRSGQAVAAVVRFYKLAPEQVLVLHDDLDLLPGQVKLKQGGGHAGHNGLKDIQSALNSADFWRLRIGIGHPRTLRLTQDVADFVLHPPRREEGQLIEAAIYRCRAVVPAMLAGDFALAMRELHSNNAV